MASDRFASRKDLVERLSEKPDFYRLRRRIRYLQKLGLIEPLVGDATNRLGYRLSKYGKRVALRGELAPRSKLQSRPSFRSQFDHDQVVNEVRDILTSSTFISQFISESELRSKIGFANSRGGDSKSSDWKVPDGQFSLRIESGEATVALEVELTRKAKARYSKIFEALLTSKQFKFVFIVCGDEKIEELLVRSLESARATNAFVKASERSNGIYFSQFEKLRRLGLEALWSGEGRTFSINELTNTQAEKG